MKKFLILLVILFTTIDMQSQNLNDFDVHVDYKGSSAKGTIDVESTGFGKKIKLSVTDASINSIYAVLFRGIPGSQYNLPMINNETENIKNPVIQEILSDGYGSFITHVETISDQKKTRRKDGERGIETVNKITINCDALRRYLEEKKVIRKFGL